MNASDLKSPEDVLSWARTVEEDKDRGRQGMMYQLEQVRRCDNEDIAKEIALALECKRLMFQYKNAMSRACNQTFDDHDVRLSFIQDIMKEARKRVNNGK